MPAWCHPNISRHHGEVCSRRLLSGRWMLQLRRWSANHLNHGLSRTTSIWSTIEHPRFLDQRPCPDGIGVATLIDLYTVYCICVLLPLSWQCSVQPVLWAVVQRQRYPHTLVQDERSSIPLPVGKAHDWTSRRNTIVFWNRCMRLWCYLGFQADPKMPGSSEVGL